MIRVRATYNKGTLELPQEIEVAADFFDLDIDLPENIVCRQKKETSDELAISFIDLATQQQKILPDLYQRIQNVMAHGRYIMGPEIDELEERLAHYIGVKYCIGVSSGSEALRLALMALGIGPGDEVITTPFSFIATAGSILQLGAVPVFVDIDPHTYNIDPNLIEPAITKKTKAILPVSLYGQCADFEKINTIGRRYSLPVIEDGAQSFGAIYKDKRSCSGSTIGCTSFFPSKPLGCYGDGGACFTNDEGIAKILRQIRVHGQDRRYHHPILGVNGRLDTFQAAVLLAKLHVFPWEIERRNIIGNRYTELIQRHFPDIIPPFIDSHNTSVYAQYTIQVKSRENFQKQLKNKGIPTAIHYPVPIHKQPLFSGLDITMPVAEKMAKRVISIPMHPYLSEEVQDYIIESMSEK